MARSIHNNFFLILVCLLVAACTGTRHLPKGEKLYTGAEIKLESAGKKDKKLIKSTAELAVRPAPEQGLSGVSPQIVAV